MHRYSIATRSPQFRGKSSEPPPSRSYFFTHPDCSLITHIHTSPHTHTHTHTLNHAPALSALVQACLPSRRACIHASNVVYACTHLPIPLNACAHTDCHLLDIVCLLGKRTCTYTHACLCHSLQVVSLWDNPITDPDRHPSINTLPERPSNCASCLVFAF